MLAELRVSIRSSPETIHPVLPIVDTNKPMVEEMMIPNEPCRSTVVPRESAGLTDECSRKRAPGRPDPKEPGKTKSETLYRTLSPVSCIGVFPGGLHDSVMVSMKGPPEGRCVHPAMRPIEPEVIAEDMQEEGNHSFFGAGCS
jgi:hypothetical protein